MPLTRGDFRQRKNGGTPVNAKVINESLTLQLAASPMVCHAMPMRIPRWLSQKIIRRYEDGMNALGLIDQQKLGLITHHDIDAFAVDGVEIDIVLSGICGTDLAVLSGREEGKIGVVRGHEAVGVITRVGAGVKYLRPGMRVVVDPNEYCGTCEFCASGQTHLCNGGANATLNIAGSTSMAPLPNASPPASGSSIPCRTTCAGRLAC